MIRMHIVLWGGTGETLRLRMGHVATNTILSLGGRRREITTGETFTAGSKPYSADFGVDSWVAPKYGGGRKQVLRGGVQGISKALIG
jgi:hypothetical protein